MRDFFKYNMCLAVSDTNFKNCKQADVIRLGFRCSVISGVGVQVQMCLNFCCFVSLFNA